MINSYLWCPEQDLNLHALPPPTVEFSRTNLNDRHET